MLTAETQRTRRRHVGFELADIVTAEDILGCPIAKGEAITRDMLAIKGPGVGLQPRYLDIVVGRVARRNIEADHPITWEAV